MTQSIDDKIQSGYYSNSKDYPLRSRIKNFKCFTCNSSVKKDDEFCSKCGHKVKDQNKLQIKDFESDLEIYREEEAKLHDLFKRECLDDVGYLNHPKADLIFRRAWSEGHSDGLHSVYSKLSDLCYFLDEFTK